MINVNQITSQLAKMPDQALQQYATLNKNDPYIMSLALAESNRRKELRTAAQGAQGAEQPPVVDEALQGMAAPMPEETGIAQLPAGDMNFADGGIVAFADGGALAGTEYGIPGMVMPSTPFMPQQGAEEQTPWFQRQLESLKTYMREQPVEQARARIAAGYGSQSDVELLKRAAMREAAGAAPTGPKTTVSERSQALQNMDPRDRRLAAAQAPAAPAQGAFRTAPTATQPTGRAVPEPSPQIPPTRNLGLGALTPSTRAAAAGPAPTARGAAASTALDPNAMFKKAEADLNAETSPDKAMLEELGKERTAAAQAELESTRKRTEKYADAYKGKRERIDKQEAELGGMKNQTLGLALLQAGAAMMSTPGGLGAALGRGVETGTRQYAAGLEKLSAAKEKIADARDRLEELERNRSEMSDKEIAAAEKNVRESGLSARENMIKYVMENRKVNRETAAKIVAQQMELGIAQLREQGAMDRLMVQERGANARAAASRSGEQSPERQVFQALVKKHGGDAVAAYNEMTSSKRPFNVAEAYADYIKAFAGKDGLTPPMSMAQYAGQFGATLPR